jgi:hypothetical protein
MAAILPYLQDDAFQPDDIKAMSMALDDLSKELKLDGDANAKKTIAVRIMDIEPIWRGAETGQNPSSRSLFNRRAKLVT